jgi:hypothetical protein
VGAMREPPGRRGIVATSRPNPRLRLCRGQMTDRGQQPCLPASDRIRAGIADAGPRRGTLVSARPCALAMTRPKTRVIGIRSPVERLLAGDSPTRRHSCPDESMTDDQRRYSVTCLAGCIRRSPPSIRLFQCAGFWLALGDGLLRNGQDQLTRGRPRSRRLLPFSSYGCLSDTRC